MAELEAQRDGGGALEVLTVRLPAGLVARMRGEAQARKVSMAVLSREIVVAWFAAQDAPGVAGAIDQALAKHVDRLAALLAKSGTWAATAAWEVNFVVAALKASGVKFPGDVMGRALARAGADARYGGTLLGELSEAAYDAIERRDLAAHPYDAEREAAFLVRYLRPAPTPAHGSKEGVGDGGGSVAVGG